MDKDEKLKFLIEQSIGFHTLFINLRNKIFAGQIVITSAICYFLFTWVEKPDNYSWSLYIIICFCGVLCTLLLLLINFRMTKIVWQMQNSTYKLEKVFLSDINNSTNSITGPYGSFFDPEMKKKIDDNIDLNEDPGKNIKKSKILIHPFKHKEHIKNFWKRNLNPKKHSGALNWFFILVGIVFIFLPFRIFELEKRHSANIPKQESKTEVKNVIDSVQSTGK